MCSCELVCVFKVGEWQQVENDGPARNFELEKELLDNTFDCLSQFSNLVQPSAVLDLHLRGSTISMNS